MIYKNKNEINIELSKKIKLLRLSARDKERKELLPVSFSSKREWKLVYDECNVAFNEKLIDPEIISWFIEASIRLDSFYGLSNSLKHSYEFLESIINQSDFKNNINLKAFSQLNGEGSDGTLIAPLSLLPITDETNLGCFSLWQYEQACDLLNRENQNHEESYPTLDRITSAAQLSGSLFFEKTKKSINESIETLFKLTNLINGHFENENISFSKIKNKLNACLGCLVNIYKYHENNEATIIPESLTLMSEYKNKEECISNIKSREIALNSILMIADFFRQTEPHSPIPYLLEKALSWGKMDFPDLLKELIQDDLTRNQIYQLTGIKETIQH